jgi:NAD(P)-dependent dehydrogenase (short-subunit alcohol dehydrogenase family)
MAGVSDGSTPPSSRARPARPPGHSGPSCHGSNSTVQRGAGHCSAAQVKKLAPSSSVTVRSPRAGVEQLGRALRTELAPHGATAGVLYPSRTDTPLIKPAFGGNAVATELLKHSCPRSLRTPITPARVAAATVRGIERRSPRITVPARLIPISLLRGLINPVIDAAIERDPKIRRLVLELERQATAQPAQTAHNLDALEPERDAAVPNR